MSSPIETESTIRVGEEITVASDSPITELADWEYEGVKSATHINPVVQVFSEDLAVYTGIDETRGLNENGTEWVHQDICTDTWLKRKGSWQCIAAHCSRIK